MFPVPPVCGHCQTPLLGPAAPRLAHRPRPSQDSCRGRLGARGSTPTMIPSHDQTSVESTKHLSGSRSLGWPAPYPLHVSGPRVWLWLQCWWWWWQAYSPTFQSRPRQPPATWKIGQHPPAPGCTSQPLHQRGENIRGVDTGHWLVAGGDQIFDWLID